MGREGLTTLDQQRMSRSFPGEQGERWPNDLAIGFAADQNTARAQR